MRFSSKKINSYSILLFIYILINGLFIYKYSLRIEALDAVYLTFGYSILILIISFIYSKISTKEIYYKWTFWSIVVAYFTLTILINLHVDGNALNIDRWSAMDVAIESILNNQYPYSAIDHLGGRTSNLPTIIIYGIPFYLLGDVGYLQSFGFIVFSLILYINVANYRKRTFGVILILLSISYLYEVYTKSDLITNFIFLLAFILHVQRKKTNNTYFLSGISTMLVLTRLVCIIPLTLLLFKRFTAWSLKNKMLFVMFGLAIGLQLILFAFHNYGTIKNFILHNPFDLQNRQIPFIVSVAFIILPFFFSHYINNTKELVLASIIFISLPTLTAFILRVYHVGFESIVEHSSFDITYFNTITPFIIYYLSSYIEDSINEQPES